MSENSTSHLGPGRSVTSPIPAVYPELRGRTVVITGGSRGIGGHFVQRARAQGVNVVAVDLSPAGQPENDAQGTDLGGFIEAQADVTSADDLDAAAELAVTTFGSLDLWINNAGIVADAAAIDTTAETARTVMDVNMVGTMLGAQAAAKRMAPGGSIVNIASVSGIRARRGRLAYCASKSAVEHLTRVMAVEFGDIGIRINAVSPGYVATELSEWLTENPALLEETLGTLPLHRVGSPEDIWGAVAFLLSDSSRYVTGHNLVVDGGSSHI